MKLGAINNTNFNDTNCSIDRLILSMEDKLKIIRVSFNKIKKNSLSNVIALNSFKVIEGIDLKALGANEEQLSKLVNLKNEYLNVLKLYM